MIPFGLFAGQSPCDPSAALPGGDTDVTGSFGPSDFVVYSTFTAQDGEPVNCLVAPFCEIKAFVGNRQFAEAPIAVALPASLLTGHVTDGDGTPVTWFAGGLVAACPGGEFKPSLATPCPGQLGAQVGIDGAYASRSSPASATRSPRSSSAGPHGTSVQSFTAQQGSRVSDFSFDARLTGVVHNTAGVAVPFASVMLRASSGGGFLGSFPATTDLSGTYTTVWVGPGPVVLSVAPPPFSALAQFATKVSLPSGTTTKDVVLEPEVSVEGTLVAGDGSPGVGVVVACRGTAVFDFSTFSCSDGLPPILQPPFLSPDGRYALSGLAARRYTIAAVNIVGTSVSGVTLTLRSGITNIVNCTLDGPAAGCVLGTPEGPTDVVATPLATAGKLSLAFTPPADGGSPILDYRLTCTGPTFRQQACDFCMPGKRASIKALSPNLAVMFRLAR